MGRRACRDGDGGVVLPVEDCAAVCLRHVIEPLQIQLIFKGVAGKRKLFPRQIQGAGLLLQAGEERVGVPPDNQPAEGREADKQRIEQQEQHQSDKDLHARALVAAADEVIEQKSRRGQPGDLGQGPAHPAGIGRADSPDLIPGKVPAGAAPGQGEIRVLRARTASFGKACLDAAQLSGLERIQKGLLLRIGGKGRGGHHQLVHRFALGEHQKEGPGGLGGAGIIGAVVAQLRFPAAQAKQIVLQAQPLLFPEILPDLAPLDGAGRLGPGAQPGSIAVEDLDGADGEGQAQQKRRLPWRRVIAQDRGQHAAELH